MIQEKTGEKNKLMKINVYNRDHIKEIRKQYRGSKGRFASRALHLIVYSLAIVGLILIVYLSQQHQRIEYVENVVTLDTTKEIISKEKANILDLLEVCESKGNENAINWEDNGAGKNRASFGAYMFKVGTVQRFIPGLTDFQAVAIASNKAESRKLAEKIIFETEGGIYNWKNCMIQKDLLSKVEFVKELEKRSVNR